MVSDEKLLRHRVSAAIRFSGKKREDVARELSRLTGDSISALDLYEHTRTPRADRAEKILPPTWIFHIANITGSHELEHFALCQECRDNLAVGQSVMQNFRHGLEEKGRKEGK